jgi:uncharacterized protein YjcR
MARLSSDKWEEIKARYAVNQMTVLDLAKQYGISHTAINKKAKLENWKRLDDAIVKKAIESRAELKREVSQVSQEVSLKVSHVEAEIDRQATDKARFHEVGVNIMAKINSMLDVVEQPSEVKELAMAHKAIYEPRFKTSPDTAIQINNTQQTAGDFKGLSDDELDTMHALLQKASA